MSMENVKKFMELVQTEEGLAKRMAALKDGLQEGEFAFKDDKEFVEKKILPLAKEYGIEFSVEDFVEFTKSQLVELSEEDLSSVSGGFFAELFAIIAIAAGSSASTFGLMKVKPNLLNWGTSTVQSASTKGETKAIASGTEQTEDSQKQREIGINFKNFVSQKKKELKAKLNDGTYLSPAARKDKINDIVNSLGGLTPDGQTITADYNEVNDDITFKSDKTSQTETYYDKIRTPLYKAQSTNLAQQYDEVYGKVATHQYDDLNQQLETKQKEKAGYETTINGLKQSNSTLQERVGHCYTQLIDICDRLIQNSYYNYNYYYQYQQWKTELQNKTFTNWNELKGQLGTRTWTDNGNTYTCISYVDTLLLDTQQIQNNNKKILQLQKSAQQAQEDIDFINNQRKDLDDQWQTKQTAFINNMKTEFDYFYGELVKSLKEDGEISKLAKEATTAEAKVTLAKKIKEKADKLVKDTFSKQLLDGCSLVVEQQGDSIGMKIVYEGKLFNQDSFSVDEFISAGNHEEIINSESGAIKQNAIEKIAKHVMNTTARTGNIELAITGAFDEVVNGTLNLELGVELRKVGNSGLGFKWKSGTHELTQNFDVNDVLNRYNQLTQMRVMEATRQKNEGTISYTPFGRKLWNSIGSQAQHVLNTIAQIEKATGNLSDVKDREAFENDLKYVADRILIQGNKPYGLKGDHHTDTSLKAEDLQKIQEFAAKIGQ